MPAGGTDCDCHCGGTVCTKWVMGALYNPIGLMGLANDANTSSCPGINNGPAGRIMHDAQYCRSKVEFDYDIATHELIVTTHTPPHIDCFDAYGYDPSPVDTCQRRIQDFTIGWQNGKPRGLTAVNAGKVVKLHAGQRVRVRMVTDVVMGGENTFPGDLFWTRLSGSGREWHDAGAFSVMRHGPAATVVPAMESVWKEKACGLLPSTWKEHWYHAGVWPYDPPLAPWTYLPGSTSGLLDTTKPTFTYGIRSFDGKGYKCMMEAPAMTPPPEHPTAPLGDKYPAVYTFFDNGAEYSVQDYTLDGSSNSLWHQESSVWVKNTPGSALNAAYNFTKYRYMLGLPNWFARKYTYWPGTRWCKEADFPLSNTTAQAMWRANYFSNPSAYQAQIIPDEPTAENPTPAPPTPVEGPPFKTFNLIVPRISRGRETASEYYTTTPFFRSKPLRPTSPTDTSWVAEQAAGWEAHFENVTIHEMTLPAYPMVSTARARDVVNLTQSYRLEYTPSPAGDYCGNSGKQNGCVAPGLLDIEMVVEIDKTGPWVFAFADSGNPLTRDGSTSVITFIVEELAPKEAPGDPDVWEPVDLRVACKPNDTPDHTGWTSGGPGWNWSSMAPYQQPLHNNFGLAPKRVNQSPYRCSSKNPQLSAGNTKVSYIMNEAPTLISYWMASPVWASIRNGATFTAYRNSSTMAEPWSIIPSHVINAYNAEVQGMRCCGYGEVRWPLVKSSCHHNRNWDSLWVYDPVRVQWRERTVAGNAMAFTPTAEWVLPW